MEKTREKKRNSINESMVISDMSESNKYKKREKKRVS
jgi:hypothetical protein